ncbi:hypothetical protein [Pengzhenrongella sp.]|jgi:hypothetical protein|uniref:hypothetical protein n=1 Tax=Pengzhenrongella sp. TaxID=2888820 RepID=UPI002F958838
MSTGLRDRQPAGVPIGGEFAVNAHPEALVDLDAPDDEPEAPPVPVHDILADRLPEAVARIEAANKKLARAGIEERFTYTTEEYLKKRTTTEFGIKTDTYELRTKLELNEPSFSYGGWTFVAALDETENGFIARTAPGQSLDGWRPDAQGCDHCGTKRHRKATYILTNTHGDRKQIGSNCLEPFLGVEVKGLWALGYDFEDLSDLESDPDGREPRGGGQSPIPTRDLIALGLAVSEGGAKFVSRAHADEWNKASTMSSVSDLLYGKAKTREEAMAREEIRDRAQGYLTDGTVDAVLASVQTVDTDSDYGYNLQTATAGEWVSPRHAAIAVSAISVWRRGQERAVAKAAIAPGFIGAEKDKIAGVTATVTKVIYTDNPFDYNGGVNTLVLFRTEDNHVVKWFASGRKEYELGDTGTFTGGTVKAQETYEGVDQTVVTRVKFAAESAPEPAAHP